MSRSEEVLSYWFPLGYDTDADTLRERTSPFRSKAYATARRNWLRPQPTSGGGTRPISTKPEDTAT